MSSKAYENAIRQTWGHTEGSLNGVDARQRELVRYATLAASSHNTQPWKFQLEPNRIVILPDLSRRCPAVDPDDHHLYASLGCAAENLLLAAQAAGLKGYYSYGASASRVHIDFEQGTPFRSALFEAIPRRQCSRTEYDGRSLTGEQLRLLEEMGRGSGVSVMLLADGRQKEQVAEYVAEANRAQFGDPAWANELKSWIRFNARDAMSTGDGLYGPVMGSPDVPRWLGILFMLLAFSAKRQNQKDIRHIRNSSAIAVFCSDVDDKPHWVEAGRCYERLALQAAAVDLRTAFSFLGIGHRRPDLIVRIGRGPEMPKSLRRPIDSVIV
jgi:hypothetical protein